MISRRTILAAAGAATPALSAEAKAVARKAPPGFLWGTAISAYQSEGGNTNTDCWLLENLTPTVYKDRSGDACDSYHRFAEDIALNAALGFNCYRFGIEWARIEPSPGKFSNAELDHYEKVLEACHAHGQTPVVTFNHFTVPLWFAVRGGWEQADAADLFARYCEHVTQRLGPLMGRATTFNEANVQLLVQVMGQILPHSPTTGQMLEAARRATGSERFSSMVYANPDVTQPILLEAHRKAYQAMKAARPTLPVGISLTTQDIQAVGENSLAPQMEARLYGGWIDAAKTDADFIGVQTYTRFRFDSKGWAPFPPGAELTAAGYEFYPQALAATIRWAHKTIGKPIYVTESGIGTDDDRRRIAFIDQALDGVRACLDEGLPVHSYLYWSLLDNFEWSSGFAKHFGLVAVDLETFKRTPKPSAYHLGRRAKLSLL
ncbi:glycoside hydrolase family 1 protein [Phenylobacterium montanum]|uniref:Glycoside hydrolase family 1 protein n=1 Tax=Phenylobacterium montanum TaxID=2823693 RepID=A0A975IVZ3_9CAUL|nr:family 1 glycosylhydrolase [Caulobacter sp. S6]QUD89343.1 glycoside hydrolase family 1 protein [Caulobacter sp. S6]